MLENNKYNLLVLLPNLTDEQILSLNKEVTAVVKKYGGEIDSEEQLGKRKLAYPIKKMRHGYYFNYVIQGANLGLKDLQKDLRLMPEVLRFQISSYAAGTALVKNFANYLESDGPVGMEQQRPAVERLVKDEVAETMMEPESTEVINEPEAGEEQKEKTKKENKISLEELDQKLDDILEDNNI